MTIIYTLASRLQVVDACLHACMLGSCFHESMLVAPSPLTSKIMWNNICAYHIHACVPIWKIVVVTMLSEYSLQFNLKAKYFGLLTCMHSCIVACETGGD